MISAHYYHLKLSFVDLIDCPYRSTNSENKLYNNLCFQGNNLTKLNKGAFGKLPVVFELNLAHNNINNITAKAFEGLLQLLVLNLTNNKITHIPNEAFHGK